jgi:hypothetical protein
MSKTEQTGWETVSVTAIPPGIEVALKTGNEKGDGGEILLPAIAILHQTLFSDESVTERIITGRPRFVSERAAQPAVGGSTGAVGTITGVVGNSTGGGTRAVRWAGGAWHFLSSSFHTPPLFKQQFLSCTTQLTPVWGSVGWFMQSRYFPKSHVAFAMAGCPSVLPPSATAAANRQAGKSRRKRAGRIAGVRDIATSVRV